MNNLTVSLNDNILKISSYDKDGLKGLSCDISNSVATDSKILDTEAFSKSLSDSILELLGAKAKSPQINFLIEPQDVILKFITVNKKDGDINEQIISEIKTKLDGDDIENLYFSYIKIAPFVYQFVGIKKDLLNMYFEIANKLGLSVSSVIPWVLLLPKFVNSGSPCIFILKSNHSNKQIVALSELNGIYFSGVYEQEKTSKELHELVQELSVYKRATPINKVYTLNYSSFSLDPKYEISQLSIPGQDDQTQGFESHLLLNAVTKSNVELLISQLNLINLIPLPAGEKKSTALVRTATFLGTIAAVFLLIGGLVLYRNHKNVPSSSQLAANSNNNSAVLSENTVNKETTESTSTTSTSDLKRNDLSVKIQNGAGISGVAAKARDYMQNLGYKVIEIGNFENSDKQNTLVKIKTSKKEYKNLLINDLKANYSLVVEDGLDETLNYDVLIVIGAK